MDSWLLIVAAMLPSMILFWYIYHKDNERPEPVWQLVKCFFYGVLSTFFAVRIATPFSNMFLFDQGTLAYNVWRSFMCAAIPEELAKLCLLLYFLRGNKHFDEYMDGIVYAACIGLGFATLENVLYLINAESWVTLGVLRGLLSVPLHFFCAVIMGYYLSLWRIDKDITSMCKMLLIPIALHGVFDVLAFSMDLSVEYQGVLVCLSVTMVALMRKRCSRLVAAHLDNDRQYVVITKMVDEKDVTHLAYKRRNDDNIRRDSNGYDKGERKGGNMVLWFTVTLAAMALAVYLIKNPYNGVKTPEEAKVSEWTQKALDLIAEDDCQAAQEMARHVLFNDSLKGRPFNAEAERVFRLATDWDDIVLRGHRDQVKSVCFDDGGTIIYTASADGTVRLWDTETGRCKHVMRAGDKAAPAQPIKRKCGFTAEMDGDSAINILCEYLPDTVIRRIRCDVTQVNDVDVNEKYLLMAMHDGTVRRKSLKPNYEQRDHVGKYMVVCRSKYYATVIDESHFHLHFVTQNGHGFKELRTDRGDNELADEPGYVKGTNQPRKQSVGLSSNGYYVATTNNDNIIRIIHAGYFNGGRVIKKLRGFDDVATCVAFSPDNNYLAGGSADNTVRIWDVRTGVEQMTLRGHTGCITSVAFSPDGKLVLSTSEDNTARIWDVERREEMRRLKFHKGAVNYGAFTSDGKYLALASDDNTITLWATKTGQRLNVPMVHAGPIMSVEFDSYNRYMISASKDGTVRVWKTGTFKEVYRIEAEYGKTFTHATFSPSGRYILAVSSDGYTHVRSFAPLSELIKPFGSAPTRNR